MNTNLNRIDRFLQCPDLEEQSSAASRSAEDEESAIKFKNADYSWTGNNDESFLRKNVDQKLLNWIIGPLSHCLFYILVDLTTSSPNAPHFDSPPFYV